MKHVSIRAFFFVLIITLPASGQNKPFWTEASSPERIGKLITADLLARSDFMMYEYNNVKAVHYAEVCTGFGAARLAGQMKDGEALKKLSVRYGRIIDEHIPNTANHVDANAYGILPLELYLYTGEERFRKQGLDLADGQWVDPLPNGMTKQTRYWIDDVWHIASLQVEAWRVTKNPIYLERAALEVEQYLLKLQQENGLFHHGEDAPFFWGRGNGWVAAGLAELLSELPENNKHHKAILKGYKTMMAALLEFQSADGMWLQLVDKKESWPETSCTGMFGYAMALGVKKGFLPKKNYELAYQKAWLALVKYIDDDGKVRDVCVGTGMGQKAQYYMDRPRITGDFHGQAPAIWFAGILLQ